MLCQIPDMEAMTMTDIQKETHEFQSEARQVLELMIHSVYSDPDIFLRELISNASDALDKLRIESLSNDAISSAGDPRISIVPDSASRTITVADNGIGMSRDDLITYLGTVAKSGTGDFIKAMREEGPRAELIGKFGVGFYSSFIVADKVVVVTRKAGGDEAWRWESTGDGTFTIEPAEKAEHGTVITLHVKKEEEGEDATPRDLVSSFKLRSLVKRYSDFVSYPIFIGDEKEPANSMKALWTRPESEVTDEEYGEFYSRVSRSFDEPLARIVYKGEGANEFHSLLFIPTHAPFDLFYREGEHGIDLYIRRVFIMNDCRDLLPEYLRFVRGVIDSEDLPLNISRELLQHDTRTAAIKRSVTRKVLDSLRRMKSDDKDRYAKFWGAFGQVLKEGIVQDARNRDAILKLCVFETTAEPSATLEEVVARMKEGQKHIYYISGGAPDALRASPKLEAFKRAGIEVLLLGHPVDDFWVSAVGKFDDRTFASVSSSETELPDADAPHDGEAENAARRIKDALAKMSGVAKTVEEVKLSSRLVDSPATFIQKGAPITPQMRAMFKAMGQDAPEDRRVLELNASHPLIKKALAASDEDIPKLTTLLLGLAQISDGEPVEGGAELARTIASMLAES